MAVKKILLDWSETGSTVYGIVERDADNALLNDADGSFSTGAVADPYWSLTEHSIIKGRYSATRSDATWADGLHTFAIYDQSGTASVPASDIIIGTGSLFIVSDTEVILDDSIAGIKVKKNAALSGFTFYMVKSTDNVTPATGLTITGQVSIDGGAFAALTNSATEIGNGVYTINLAAADLNGDTITLKFTASGANPEIITIITQ